MQERSPLRTKDMARLLQMRKKNNHSTVLFLGAQAGGLFRSEHFFTCLREFSQNDVISLSRTAQFSHHFSTLTDTNLFSETDIHSIFRTSLQEVTVTKADLCLAELIKQFLFDDIICTSIDNLLETSLVAVEMKEQRDFEIFFHYQDLLHEKKAPARIVKVFGDFSARQYNLKRYLNRSEQEQMRALQRILAKDLLIVGLDPRWDRHILDMIPVEKKAGMIWLASEDDLSREESVAALLRQRPSQVISGREGRFEYFIPALHNHLFGGGGTPLNYQLLYNLSSQLAGISSQLTGISSRLADFSIWMQAQQDSYSLILSEIRNIQEEISKLQQDK